MLGGSAPPQPSGAPFRPVSGNRTMAWPPPAHQNDIFNRGYGIYSLFPGPGDPPGTLYTPTAKMAHTGSPFADYPGAQKVPDDFFSSKFTFGASITPQINNNNNDNNNSKMEIPQKAKNFTTKCEEQEEDGIAGKESKSKRLSDDVVIIKSELEEVNKRQGEEKNGEKDGDGKEGRKIDEGKNGMSHILSNVSEPRAAGVGVVFANEPDSTGFGIQKPYDESEDGGKDKCNIIDLSGGKKKTEKCLVKCESINDICSRLEKKCKSKVKSEGAKPTLSGGCSRTTPVTFKHAQTEQKPMSVEVPQLIIKKEPSDFQKYPFLSPGDPYYSPTMDVLSPGRYPDYTSFLSPRSYLGPRTPSETPFLSPNIDIEAYDNFRSFRKELDSPKESFLSPTSTNPDPESDDNKKSRANVATVTPCQVAEVTSATLSPKIGPLSNPLVVKQETTVITSVSATSTVSTVAEEKKEMTFLPTAVTSAGSNIPVGIAVARQRCQRHNEIKVSSNSVPPPVVHRAVQSSASIDLSSTVGAAVYSGGVACDDRSTNLITSWPSQPHNPTLWQYSAPIDYPPFPPVGFQLVRDPMTGHFLLIPAANIEALQRAILWPSYQPTPPQMIIPPMSVPPNTQHLLLDTNVPAVDFLTPDAIHHNAPQHRILITTDSNNAKRKIPGPTVIKLETSDCSNAVVVTACESSNAVYTKAQPVSPTPGHEPVFFPQRQSGANENGRRSQATSPVSCLSPVEDTQKLQETEPAALDPPHQMTMVTLQDASNQTETPLQSEDETSQPPPEKDKFEPYTKVTEPNVRILKTTDVGTEANIPRAEEPDDKRKDLKIHISNVPDLINVKKEIISPSQVDLSGLELLSNSIEQFVTERKTDEEDDGKDLSNDACEGAVLLQNLKNGFREEIKFEEEEEPKLLGGLGLLCALAEQRFREEIEGEDCDFDDGPKKISDTPPASPHSRRSSRKSKEMSPPILEKATDYFYDEDNEMLEIAPKLKSKMDVLRPPTLTPNTILEPKAPMKLPRCEVNLIALDETKIKSEEESRKRKSSTDAPLPRSKKRKVGRPKKCQGSSETIVAKKLKTKPPNYLFQPIQPVPENPDEKPRKIKPKLKAEAKVKDLELPEEEENIEWQKKEEKKVKVQMEEITESVVVVAPVAPKENKKENNNLQSCVLTTDHLNNDKFPIRTLTVMGGLFYAGQLSAIRAPDVYGITIDGERGHRPHIYSREEILKDSILEVKPESTGDLPAGTRVCAYWSEQYRCLYPGTVSAPTPPDPELDDKFVNVEFDDGDSGRINIDDVRLLPEDYPIIEYDPNPLQSLTRRKRRISGASVESHSKERKSTDSSHTPDSKKESITNEEIEEEEEEEEEEPEPMKLPMEPQKTVQIFEPEYVSSESERRHLKKKRREKLKRLQSLSLDGKKKHKKHKCSEEHRHHRHHKKHKKHKHKHGKRHGEEKHPEETVQDEAKENQGEVKNKNKSKSVEKACGLSEKSKVIKPKKCKERTESVESRSKMAAFLPARQLWGWSGKGYKRPGAKGRAKKEFYKTIQRGKERITVGDCAVFLSTGRPDRPYIGRIESMWESWGTNMVVRVKWFYHPEETVGCPASLEYPGALFESPHVDENDVQTISHKCEVLPLKEYTEKLGNEPHRYETIYDNNDIYYLAGYYDPTNTTLKMEPGVK